MHILTIALFFINVCHYGRGHPVVSKAPLQDLANVCENSFLANTIKKESDKCIINGTVKSNADLECYMFYDINVQLCDAFQHSEFQLKENYEANMKGNPNVAALCNNAKAWKFVTLQTYPAYNVLVTIFNDSVRCQKLCGVDNLLKDDANFYCAYFNWGTELIQSQAQTIPIQENNLVLPVEASSLNTGKNSVTSSTNNNNVSEMAAKTEVKPVDTNLTKPVESTGEVSSVKSEKKNQDLISTKPTASVEKAPETANKGGKITEPSAMPVSSVNEDVEHPAVDTPPHEEKPLKSDGQEEQLDTIDGKGKSKEVPEDAEMEDEYDHDEIPAEGINKNNNGGVESDPDVGFKDNNKPNLKIESITFPPQRVPDIFPNGIPDSFTDDDDHFFPIFLTGIILVVLLYILYHNKSKFTKVILGLLVEGRQSGRRRNSRGHAYRRLDTLEQAMSSNTAAPPSKIIY